MNEAEKMIFKPLQDFIFPSKTVVLYIAVKADVLGLDENLQVWML